MSDLVSFNTTIDDTSPLWTYAPYGDTQATGGQAAQQVGTSWVTWYSSSQFVQSLGESPAGDSFHITSHPGASASLSFFGTGVYVYGLSNASYQVTFDGSIRSTSASNGILFSTSGEMNTIHNVSIIANSASSDQVLSLNQAIVTSETNMSTGSSSDLTINNQNTSLISYSGDWTPNKSVQDVPSASSPAPFHYTTSTEASASVSFRGRSVALYGSTTFGHGEYGVTLDGQQSTFNGSSTWLIGDMLMFYRDGLDPDQTHSLRLQNLNEGMALSLNSVVIKQLSSDAGSSDTHSTHTTGSAKVGIIVGCIAAALFLAGIASFLFWRRRRSRHQMVYPDMGQHSPLSSSTFLPEGLRINQGNAEGAVTPYIIDLQRPQGRAVVEMQSSERELKGAIEEGNSSGPQLPSTSQNVQPRIGLVERSSRRAPPQSIPETYTPPSEVPESPVSTAVSTRMTERPHEAPNLRSRSESDPAFVDRVTELVFQRIGALRPAEASSSYHDQSLPPYVEDEHVL